ncbi:hypothetical protein U0039_22155 [Stenotrophomonas maltophilia]|uniref:hypothetical protein n=1 Tax=Stenotrophomonas maltophilia TaxID=40324 RepID=UPI00117CEE5A|nr:hypothetical protein [Stenotrophomonas maltophilia]QQA82387.1 hypothetical protein I6I01_20755 [Stenotrophomonas maltophilia]WQE23573.1 hypothetical protein U0039_22155 [Stenotrophomonas maltophilia]HDS1018959.1 hypothetical protein [Stenotrophomonas maltophilia]
MNIPPERKFLGNGLVIFSDGMGVWRLEGPSVSFSLEGKEALRRAITLLEFPFENVISDLGRNFPYPILVQIGLNHDSDYWIGLALSWVPFLAKQDVELIIDDLNSVAFDKKVSQKNRVMAKREITRVRNM